MLVMRLRNIWIALAGAVVLFLAFAWFDGGLQQQRMIVQPVPLPAFTAGAAR